MNQHEIVSYVMWGLFITLIVCVTVWCAWEISKKQAKEERLKREAEQNKVRAELKEAYACDLALVRKEHADALIKLEGAFEKTLQEIRSTHAEELIRVHTAGRREGCGKSVFVEELPVGKYSVRAVLALPSDGPVGYEMVLENPAGNKNGLIFVRIPPPDQKVPVGTAFNLVVEAGQRLNHRYRFYFEEIPPATAQPAVAA